MDGSQKLPQRLLGTLADGLAAGRGVDGLVLAVAGWMRYMGGTDDAGAPIELKDPLAEQLKAASDKADGAAERVAAFLSFRDIFPAEMAENAHLTDALTRAYAALEERGAHACVKEYADA